MRKILIVGDFNEEMLEMNSYLSQHFDTQLCTDSNKTIKSMLKVYGPDIVLMNIDNFGLMHNEIFISISEYDINLPMLTYGMEKNKTQFISFYYSGQCKHVSHPYTKESILSAICKEFNMDEDVLLRETPEVYKKHILVVDDNAVLLRNMRNMLQDKYRVSVATSAAQCMKIIGQDRTDLIILDYEMPVVDGRQTLEMIRAEEDYADIPVIFLTGIADKSHVDAVLDLKPAGYFVKPPMQTKIVNAIEAIFEKQ